MECNVGLCLPARLIAPCSLTDADADAGDGGGGATLQSADGRLQTVPAESCGLDDFSDSLVFGYQTCSHILTDSPHCGHLNRS